MANAGKCREKRAFVLVDSQTTKISVSLPPKHKFVRKCLTQAVLRHINQARENRLSRANRDLNLNVMHDQILREARLSSERYQT
jgi:hypothetical protein